ncbi:hypothetical protein PAXRUDRAFT_822865 [Paxillus rubicundulus Ve08.2h10]|uniref:Uncharacterized protein n=1 Tax=Paxillus rubicundulus Ve08.2h10 TaxID=930991 RepID=A0A0D0DL64_9AGAM|nr:hypothetical protein PAXRUDRAFT_822865 [Paxillus rubicundulus Ve08.2h10]
MWVTRDPICVLISVALWLEVKPPWVKEWLACEVCAVHWKIWLIILLAMRLSHVYDIRPPGMEKIPHTLVLRLIKRVRVG